MKNRYRLFPDVIKQTLNHCGAMKKHFSNAIGYLENLKKTSELKQSYFKRVNIELNRANRTGLRVGHHFNLVKTEIEKILADNEINQEYKDQLNEFNRRISVDDSLLTLKTSYFVGKLGEDISALESQLRLFSTKRCSREEVLPYINKLIDEIKSIIALPEFIIPNKIGLIPFMVLLKKYLLPIAKKIKSQKLEEKSIIPPKEEKS